MPAGNLTMLDLAVRTGSSQLHGIIDDVLISAPEINTIPVQPMAGTTYKITRNVELPVAEFRSANVGIDTSKSRQEQDVKQMYFLDCQLETDEAIVKGDPRELEDILAGEAARAIKSAFIKVGDQTWYGSNETDSGFEGIRGQVKAQVKAGGTTNSTSAYLLRLGTEGVMYPVGLMGALSMGEWQKQQITKNSKKLMAWVNNFSTYIGLQVGSAYSAWAVTGITKTNGQDFTDARAEELVSEIPVDARQNLVWFVNRTALFTLQKSRSAISNVAAGARSGAAAWSPRPVDVAGYPIVLTDSIRNTETNS